MSDISTLILEELVFEKVCVGARMADLILFEEDLDRSIIRALDGCGDDDGPAEERFERHLEAAWKRWIKEQEEGTEPAFAVEVEDDPENTSSTNSLMKAYDNSWRFGGCPSAWPPSSNASSE